MAENPYEPPLELTRGSVPTQIPPLDATYVVSALLRWSFICGISAVPSFIWGYQVVQHPDKIAAMVIGILVFVVGYALLNVFVFRGQILDKPLLKRTVFIGYGTRLLISIVFPLGMLVDMFPGIISVGIANLVVPSSGGQDAAINSFTGAVVGTIVQGILLNLVLLGFMLLVHVIQLLIVGARRNLSPQASPEA